ncbi:MAG: hypothetical protein D6743_11935 [Calditrichaeota bacterium]|nr:MAG: hypothetical protein D6743_11935 [Calditrichota bacterium]
MGRLEGVVGAEDITVYREAGLAFISSDDRRATLAGRPVQGAIYALDLNSRPPVISKLTSDVPTPFHPHGISLYVSGEGLVRLFVINHRNPGEAVELFDYEDGRLIHRESISGPQMHSPNDLVAVGPRQFYVTNDHGNTSALGRTLEEYLRLGRGNVLFYDGETFHLAAQGIRYANGINVSRDRGTVFVASTTGGKILVYNRNGETNRLTKEGEIDLRTGVDNIELDEAGNLWVAAHPKLLTFVEHAKDEAKRSPSQVLEITWPEREVREMLLDGGEKLSGSSVAARYQQTLLVGSVFEKHFLVCELPN